MFLPRKFNVCDDHLIWFQFAQPISLELVECEWLIWQLLNEAEHDIKNYSDRGQCRPRSE